MQQSTIINDPSENRRKFKIVLSLTKPFLKLSDQPKLAQKRPLSNPHHLYNQPSIHPGSVVSPTSSSPSQLAHHRMHQQQQQIQQSQQQQQMSKIPQKSSSSSRTTAEQQSYSEKLKYLAKQQLSSKDDDVVETKPAHHSNENERRSESHGSHSETPHRIENEQKMDHSRLSSPSFRSMNDARHDIKKHSSPQPPEKV